MVQNCPKSKLKIFSNEGAFSITKQPFILVHSITSKKKKSAYQVQGIINMNLQLKMYGKLNGNQHFIF